MSWIFPDPRVRTRYGAAYFQVHAERSFRAGTAEREPGGAALWDAPRTWRLTTRESLRLVARMAPGLGRRLPVVGAGLGAIEAAHPAGAHWYLAVLGVRPEQQGRGLGGRLLGPGLERADASGLPCYLESSNPRNVLLYERHGFRVTGEHRIADGPLMTFMWRDAPA